MPVNPKRRHHKSWWKTLVERRGWGYPDALKIQGSVFLNVIPVLAFITAWATLLTVLYMIVGITSLAVSSNLTASVAVVVALLLAFRTNNSYNQYNEGRRLFTSMCTIVRNCTRTLWIGGKEKNSSDRLEKEDNIKLLLAYVIAVKHHIRYEFGIHWPDLKDLLPDGFQKTYYEGSAVQQDTGDDTSLLSQLPIRTISSKIPPTMYKSKVSKYSKEKKRKLYNVEELSEVDASMSLPLEIVFHLNLYFVQLHKEQKLEPAKFGSLANGLDALIEILGSLERIGSTPLPTAYNVHLKQACVLYMLALPFTILADLDWFTIPTMALVAFIFFGILAVGSEIENPFGYDDNDLPLDEYCKDLEAEVKYLQRHLPSGLASSKK
ncbi:Bestrophin, RFP-TM, chloride channel-domain-containing protein [Gigaspora rosea]|uniref:Bestrophin, RFP-TM, chloride channel-domain-containing protein n=1 Tax=Gigaspora rosea TaxID=44941 RepID=A0A397UV00_9GLOM|nr:Bestrophin, RFP-TM, chloride channel-domain-containing protein [Gigaspora rosea]